MEWRRIPGFGLYEVSEDGRIRCQHQRQPGHPPSDVYRFLVGYVDKDGYRRVRLIPDGGGRRPIMGVHTLVLLAFVGPRPVGTQGSHLDGDALNNSRWNLVWESCADNIRRKAQHGTQTRGEKIWQAKLTEADVADIRARHRGGSTLLELGHAFGVNARNIRAVVTRRTWKHVA